MLFEAVVGAYLSARQADRREYRESASLRILTPFFGGRDMLALKRVDVRGYIQGRHCQGVKTSTVLRELRLLSAALNFCRRELDRPDIPNPVAALGLREPEGRARWITRVEAGRLIAAIETGRCPWAGDFVRLALNTGCRRGELLGLEWSRVDLECNLLHFEAQHVKSRRRQSVPLNADAVACLTRLRAVPGLARWVFGEPGAVTLGALQRAWYPALKRAGIEDFRIHDLRHTFASWLVMQGESLYVVKQLLRHSSIKVTERYAHLAPEQTASAVQRLLPF